MNYMAEVNFNKIEKKWQEKWGRERFLYRTLAIFMSED